MRNHFEWIKKYMEIFPSSTYVFNLYGTKIWKYDTNWFHKILVISWGRKIKIKNIYYPIRNIEFQNSEKLSIVAWMSFMKCFISENHVEKVIKNSQFPGNPSSSAISLSPFFLRGGGGWRNESEARNVPNLDTGKIQIWSQ